MLLAPFLLTLGLGAVTGSFSSMPTGIEAIPVMVVNEDGGEFGVRILDALQQPELARSLTYPYQRIFKTGWTR